MLSLRSIKYVGFLFLLVTILTACWRSDRPRYFYVDPLINELFHYKRGSYWLMQDSATGRTDSFVVIVDTTKMHNGSYESYYQDIGMEIDEYDSGRVKTGSFFIYMNSDNYSNTVQFGFKNNAGTIYDFLNFCIQSVTYIPPQD